MEKNKLDPRTKLTLVLCISSLSVIIQNINILTGILVISIIISNLLGANIYSVIKKIKGLVKIFIAIIIIQSLFINYGEAIIQINGYKILTDVGLIKGLEFIFRMAIIIVSATIITTSSSREIVQGLIQLKIKYEIAFMVSVGIRFLPILTQEIKDSIKAIQLRGIEINKLSIKKRIEIYSYIFMPVVAGSIIKAQNLSTAMETRAFRAYDKRSSFNELKLNNIDYLIIIGSFLFTILILALYLK
ncbi:MAG: energy-coupling factor transporter transmembrane protein EcfT [Firmicutes bacterium]|nr:energy-coupling factor transporter transmembrane protein EcfT [Bacillota bacterium]